MESETQTPASGRFTCNVCGAANRPEAGAPDREGMTCVSCRSSMRFRSIVLALSRALFGTDLKLDDFPRLKSLRGMGISDSEVYAARLTDRFSYTNTFYHREPAFDLSRPDETEFGKYDFVVCSEVLEHVPHPVDRALQTLARLLKPAGVLILTVPYSLDETVEHFPQLRQSGLAEIEGRTVLVNRAEDGRYQVFDDLVFHRGHGSTLEMRVFSESGLRAALAAAGLARVRFESAGNAEFGVVFEGPCSLPVVASREPFSLSVSGAGEMAAQLAGAHTLLDAVARSRWVRFGRRLGLGPEIPPRRPRS
jgi:SAM-dependent methyltransferase